MRNFRETWEMTRGWAAPMLGPVTRNPNPDTVTSKLKQSKYAQLRYLMHKGRIYTADADSGTHGDIASARGISRSEWERHTLSGFIHGTDLADIKRAGLKKWILNRHHAALHNPEIHQGYGARYIPENKIYQKIQTALSDDLRRKPWRGCTNQMAGHCYVASEALYHILGGKRAGLKSMFVHHEGAPHWFLRDSSGKNIDITSSQFKTPVPYDKATGKGFLTKKPSRRAQIVMSRIK